MGGLDRDNQDVEALITDRYLDSILAAHARAADAGPAPMSDMPDPRIRLAAERLARHLPRFHPSFRFEEALSARLGEAAARMGPPAAAGAERVVIPLWPGLPPGEDLLGPHPEARPAFGRPLLIGGALTSAALSIVGAAYVAWRFRRAPRSPMARAVRAVARTRLA